MNKILHHKVRQGKIYNKIDPKFLKTPSKWKNFANFKKKTEILAISYQTNRETENTLQKPRSRFENRAMVTLIIDQNVNYHLKLG